MWFDEYPLALSIDIEALALDPRAYVLQIGFAISNVVTGEVIASPQNIWIKPGTQDGRVIDPNTVRWWLGQNPLVIRNVLAPGAGEPVKTPEETFKVFESYVENFPNLLVWAKPSTYDLPILGTLWGRDPWSHRQEADLQTLIRIVDPQGALKPDDNRMAHDAAADAAYQLEYLTNIVKHMRHVEVLAALGKDQP